jgi:BlaI family penicillinase repressor
MALTPAEWRLMHALWQFYPATGREIARRLPPDTRWAYTTIKTMLSRLVAKGVLREEKEGKRISLYEPLVSPDEARMDSLRAVADDAFDGAMGQLAHFLVENEKLSASERRKLLDLLNESTAGEQKGSKER